MSEVRAAAESARLRPRRNSERNYPASEVRGGGQRSYPASEVGGLARGATLRLRSGAKARRSDPTPPCPRPGAAAGRSYPTSKEPWLRGRRRA